MNYIIYTINSMRISLRIIQAPNLRDSEGVLLGDWKGGFTIGVFPQLGINQNIFATAFP